MTPLKCDLAQFSSYSQEMQNMMRFLAKIMAFPEGLCKMNKSNKAFKRALLGYKYVSYDLFSVNFPENFLHQCIRKNIATFGASML